MCGRFSRGVNLEALIKYYSLHPGQYFSFLPQFNISPTQVIPIVVQRNDFSLDLEMVSWGFPLHMKDKPEKPIFNARAETVYEKRLFKSAFETSRCLIPATGFYEFSGPRGNKQPHYFTLKDTEIFSFAGLWKPSNDGKDATCCIITTTPNEVTEPVHNRMPVILKRDDEITWLSSKDMKVIRSLLSPFTSEDMAHSVVSGYVNKSSNGGPECIAPIAP